jgi:hypothetical protein
MCSSIVFMEEAGSAQAARRRAHDTGYAPGPMVFVVGF